MIWEFIHVDAYIDIDDVLLMSILIAKLSILMPFMPAMMDELILKISDSYDNGKLIYMSMSMLMISMMMLIMMTMIDKLFLKFCDSYHNGHPKNYNYPF